MSIRLLMGDITHAKVDVIVNAANSGLLGGGGVDGAIHRAAGPALLTACKLLPVTDGIRCPTGAARITPAGNLACRYVIHTVGPIYLHSQNPAQELAAAYRSSLQLAQQYHCQSIAFPAISCGVYGYPLLEAGKIALTTCNTPDFKHLDMTFYLFNQAIFQQWQKILIDFQSA